MTDDQLKAAVEEVVRDQKAAGVDIVNEGELTKGGIWVTYIHERFGGFEPIPAGDAPVLPPARDWTEFADYYKARTGGSPGRAAGELACVGPVTYKGQALLQREIDLLVGALGDTPRSDAFLTSTAPLSLLQGRRNDHYRTEDEFIGALADAIRVEYRMIVDAGLLLQVDDAWLAALWDRIGHQMGLEAYRRYCAPRVEALNYALEASRPSACAITCAGGHGPGRTPTTSRCSTSWT